MNVSGLFGLHWENVDVGQSNSYDQVWEGTITIQGRLRVEWKPLLPMLEPRHGHVSLLIDENLYCIGGWHNNSTEYYSFQNKVWKKGPDLPFTLGDARCVFNPVRNQHFIIGGCCNGEMSSNLYIFHPQKGLIEIEGEMDIPCAGHIAVLL